MILRKLQSTLLGNRLASSQIHTSSNCASIPKVFTKFLRMYEQPTKVNPPYGHCVQIGDPILRLKAQEIPKDLIKSEKIQSIINQMKKVHRDYNLVGIAAPQIGISYRIIIMEFGEKLKEKYPSDVYENRQMSTLPLTICINPVINVKNFNQIKFPEGCASVCGYTGDVNRYEEVLLSGFNENGESTEVHLKGWNARIAQHEVDHLNGQVFVDIMEKKSFNCVTWAAVNRNGGQLSIPFYPTKDLLRQQVIE